MSVYEDLRRRAAELADERDVDPATDIESARGLVATLVAEYQANARAGLTHPLTQPETMAERIVRSLTEWGPLSDLLSRTDIEEVFIEGDRVAFIEAGGRLLALNEATTEQENRQIVERLLHGTGRRLDATAAIQQAHVLGGRARLTAVIEPVSRRLSATIRLYTAANETLGTLVRRGVWPAPAAAFLWCLAQVRGSVLFAGPTGAGKTTALGAFLRAVPSDQCVRVVEEVRELNVGLSLHSSFYEASGIGLAGERRYTLRDLIKACLAMRVDMLCVGEVRGAEAFELTRAVNSGGGFCCTIHSDSASKALTALLSSALMAGENVPADALRMIFSESLEAVCYLDRHISKTGESYRECREIVLVGPLADSRGSWVIEPLFERNSGELRWTGLMPDPELTDRIGKILPTDVKLSMVLEGEWFPE